MLKVEAKAVYIGANEGSFTGRDGSEIHFRKAKFSIRDSADMFTLSVDKDCNLDALISYQDAYLLIDFSYNEKSAIWNGRLLDCSLQELNTLDYDSPF